MILNFETNGVRFDYPSYEDTPMITYCIATSPRCGSNMLQRALWKTKNAGAPEEYLTRKYEEDFTTRFPSIISYPINNYQNYISNLFKVRTSPNGVFGIKMHGSHLNRLSKLGHDISSLLREPKFIWMKRRNKIYQAVSYVIANQSNIWIVDGKWVPLKQSSTTTLKYDFNEITSCLRDILWNEEIWSLYFSINSIQPFVVWYEDLVSDYQNILKSSFQEVGITPIPSIFQDCGISRQASSINDHWASYYIKECAEILKDYPINSES